MERRINKKVFSFVLWGIVFLGAFFVGMNIHYSDGDDAFFYQYSHSMGFLEYLKWRYESWTGRLSAEALLYLTFRCGIWFWRVINAFVLTVLPVSLLFLADKARQRETGTGMQEEEGSLWLKPEYCLLALSGYLFMNVRTLGYAGIWITGSVNYTWCILCLVCALFPAADRVFLLGRFRKSQFVYAIPCAAAAAMSVEQTGAVLIAFLLLALGYLLFREHKTEPLLLVQTILSILLFTAMFAAPGNELRVQTAIETCMPQFETLSFGDHLFLTVQWLISSFGNENVLFLAGIWITGGVLIRQNRSQRQTGRHQAIFAAFPVLIVVFTLSALLSCFGAGLFSDMGIRLSEMTGMTEEVFRMSDMTGQNLFAMLWWTAALLFTFALLWYATGRSALILLTYLGSIAAEAILYFSPTIYSSGERVFFLTDIMLLFVLLCLYGRIAERKRQYSVLCVLLVLGGVHFLYQIPEVLAMI